MECSGAKKEGGQQPPHISKLTSSNLNLVIYLPIPSQCDLPPNSVLPILSPHSLFSILPHQASMSLPNASSDNQSPSLTDCKSQAKTPTGNPYKTFNHRATALWLKNACETGVLGSGPAEPDPAKFNLCTYLLRTIPYQMLLVQLPWSALVTFFAYFMADKTEPYTTFSKSFWDTRVSVSTTVSYGVGWAVFVLLGFFIREAADRFREAQCNLASVSDILEQSMRHIVQVYPPGTWHPGDQGRLVAHLVAYPIALKMTLRGEREAEQLATILHEDDIRDVLRADSMYIHCMQVVRSYLTAAEDDQHYGFKPAVVSTRAGWGTRYLIMDMMDTIDDFANKTVRIAEFRPSAGYINHLHILLYIWFFFLPLALVKSSGW